MEELEEAMDERAVARVAGGEGGGAKAWASQKAAAWAERKRARSGRASRSRRGRRRRGLPGASAGMAGGVVERGESAMVAGRGAKKGGVDGERIFLGGEGDFPRGERGVLGEEVCLGGRGDS